MGDVADADRVAEVLLGGGVEGGEGQDDQGHEARDGREPAGRQERGVGVALAPRRVGDLGDDGPELLVAVEAVVEADGVEAVAERAQLRRNARVGPVDVLVGDADDWRRLVRVALERQLPAVEDLAAADLVFRAARAEGR